MIIATAGHVDHGKTLLIKALTGTDTDRLPEEKKRGLTIDLGFAYLPLENGPTIGFVDVPGHERFIRNMLCGVGGIDFVLFVLAADDGIKPQTEEHLQIIDLLAVTDGALVITKVDRVPKSRIDEVAEEFGVLASDTRLKNIPLFPVSALNGEGIDELRKYLSRRARNWTQRSSNGNFRLPVDRSFTITGAGLVATGTVSSGRVRQGETLRALPGNIEVRVRGLHSQNKESRIGQSGERVALNLSGPGISKDIIKRGSWIVSNDVPPLILKFDADLRVLSTEVKPLAHWTPVHVHSGAGETTGRVAILESSNIPPGSQGLVQILIDEPLGALHGDRFIIRDQSARRTIGGGIVIDIYPPKRGRAKPERLSFLKTMRRGDHAETLSNLLEIADAGLSLEKFFSCRNLSPEEQTLLLQKSKFQEVRTASGTLGFRNQRWDNLRTALIQALDVWHTKNPDHNGPNEDRLLSLLGLRLPEGVSAALAADLVRTGHLIREGTAVRLPSHQPALTGKDEAIWHKVTVYMQHQGLKPPSVNEMAAEINVKAAELERLMIRAGRIGRVQRISKTRFLTLPALRELAQIAEGLAKAHPKKSLEVKEFRDKTGIGRNMTIEVLEYFDRIKFTRRLESGREILKPAEQAVGS